MLGRVEDGAHDARLSVDLALQTATQGARVLPERSPAAGGASAGLDFGSGKWPGGKAAARATALIVSRNFN